MTHIVWRRSLGNRLNIVMVLSVLQCMVQYIA